MSSRQLKLIEWVNELALLTAFESDLCLTLFELRTRGISTVPEHVYKLVDYAVKRGFVHYYDPECDGGVVRDEECTVSLVRRAEPGYIRELTEKIRKAKLPANNRVCKELYDLYCMVMHAELVHVANEICRAEGISGYYPSHHLGSFQNKRGLTLNEIAGYMGVAARLRAGVKYANSTDTLLSLTSDLMVLGRCYQFSVDPRTDIAESDYILRRIFLDEYLFKGQWSLNQKPSMPLFSFCALSKK